MNDPRDNSGDDHNHESVSVHTSERLEMQPWKRRRLTSSTIIYWTTEDEEHAADALLLLSERLRLIHQGKGDGEDNTMITNERIVEEPIIENRKEDKLQDTHRYECKTCNRRFPSFQALGGHRTSHKKPKSATTVSIQNSSVLHTFNHKNFIDDVGCNLDITLGNSFPPPIASSSFALTNNTNNGNKKKKVHECSICGTKFFSGQALGGHMRRHRTMVLPPKKESTSPFSLDLNLPAPYETDHGDPRNSAQAPPPSTSTTFPFVDSRQDTDSTFRIGRLPLLTINPDQNTK